MAAVGTALLSRVLGHSQAEKAFRPWWDSLEDYLYLIYCLVMIGVGLVPTAIVTGTPLDCNFCQRDCCGGNINWCGGHGAEVQLQTHHHRLLLRCGSVGGWKCGMVALVLLVYILAGPTNTLTNQGGGGSKPKALFEDTLIVFLKTLFFLLWRVPQSGFLMHNQCTRHYTTPTHTLHITKHICTNYSYRYRTNFSFYIVIVA